MFSTGPSAGQTEVERRKSEKNHSANKALTIGGAVINSAFSIVLSGGRGQADFGPFLV